ncbi:MAG: exosome complex RNA-binding protein Csl4 [Thermoprotei archaeon]
MGKSNSIKRIVTPGEMLGVEEEYMPIQGTYVDKNGYVRASTPGILVIDRTRKTIAVKHVRGKPIVPKPGDVVEGIVSSMSDELAFIDIYMVNDRYSRSIDFTGIIHISQASPEFLSSLYDAFRIGEVIRAKVLNNMHPYQLTTKEPGLGVILAYCNKCGSILIKRNGQLICPRCGNVEKRKASIFYLYRG